MAVCCSSDSVRSRLPALSSLKRRTFSIAIIAWAAKVCTSAIWAAVKGRTSRRPQPITPTGTRLRRIGMARNVR